MTSLDSLHAPVREDWLGLRKEEILEPGRSIVNPHHLWDQPGGRYLFPELVGPCRPRALITWDPGRT